MILPQVPAGVSPLDGEQVQKLQSLMQDLTPIQQAWIGGYLAASATSAAAVAQPAAVPATVASPLTILYGSQTGNAKQVAQSFFEKAKERGLDARLVNMADFKPAKIKDERYLTIVVSTHGEGEPPESAAKLLDFLASKKAPKLNDTKIAVLGLGDTSYEFFCKAAVDFEERLIALGASVVRERALLDVDYEDHTDGWMSKAIDVFEPDLKSAVPAAGNVVPIIPDLKVGLAPCLYDKKNPFEAEVGVVQKITGRDSKRDVRHIEISLDDSGLQYAAGDSLGIYFQNDPQEVDAALSALKLDGEIEVEVGDHSKSLRDALIEDFELTQSYPGFVTAYAEAAEIEFLSGLAADRAALRDYLEDRQIFDILREHPAPISAEVLTKALRKMQPRLYSVASSQAEVDDEVHLTVGVVEYDAYDRPHLGGASGFLGRRIEAGDRLRIFVQENENFRLPANPDAPVIMVGPGTGIAPFRAFLQEREAGGAEGANWLFFGNQHFTQDFLYQTELQAYLKSGLLTHLSVAFSRDQKEKVYVQDRMREQGVKIWNWLEDGAYIYVCGDATAMAKDVQVAILDIIMQCGGYSKEGAERYLEDLRDRGRYQRDVY